MKDNDKKIEQVATASLVPYAKNAKKHDAAQVAAIAGSIREFGFNNPVLIDGDNGIIAGHGRVLAAHQLGLERVPCLRLTHLSDTQKRAYILADNRLAELGGGWDAEMLAAELESLSTEGITMEEIGFDVDALEELGAGLDDEGNPEADAEPQIDKAEELRAKWGVEPGQLWELGDHRLLCGDCRKSEDVNALMGKNKCNIAFTSPPYAEQREYDATSGFKPIKPDEFVSWFEPVQQNVRSILASDGSWFVNIKPCAENLDTNLYVFDLVIAHVRLWKWHFATEFCWERNGVPKQVRRRFKNQFEPVYQFAIGEWKIRPDQVMHQSDSAILSLGEGSGNTSWKDKQGKGGVIPKNRRVTRPRKPANVQQGQPHDIFGDDRIVGMAYPGNRLPTFVGTHEALGHSAAFPIGLPAWFIKAFTDKSDVVYEPFSGSGSTLIACEQLGRKCRAIEISPAYVAVALQRWADATGKTPKLAA